MITPSDFSNPDTAKIIELEKEYSKGTAEGKPFEEMKKIRNKIKALKSDITGGRGNGDKIR
jgi:protein-arginine kinase activator protein McsA